MKSLYIKLNEATTDQMYETTTDAAGGTTETVEEITITYYDTDGIKQVISIDGTIALEENEKGA